MCILDHMQSTLFCLWKLLMNLTDDQCSSITKGSIYHIKHTYIHPFNMEADWPEIWRIMEVSTVFCICTYCVLLCGADFEVLYLSSSVDSVSWMWPLFQLEYLLWIKNQNSSKNFLSSVEVEFWMAVFNPLLKALKF